MKYDIKKLIEKYDAGEQLEYVFFFTSLVFIEHYRVAKRKVGLS